MAQRLTAPVPTTGMPKGIPYIIGNEAAERFSFYGMKAVLTVFMVSYLHLMGSQVGEAMPDAKAEANFHYFTAAVYATPFLGALLADLFFGKYRTIITLSLVYCVGHGALALMGIAGDAGMWMIAGLGLIALGSGGIKPCVSAHVGDQFGKSNSHLITTVFFWFYFSINVGSFVSTLLTPWLLQWYGPHWAFGVPGVLMALATFLFWMGRKVFVHIPADGAGFAKELFSSNGLKTVASLFVIYAFVAVFWALFDQTGSSWVLQARDMDLEIDLLLWSGTLLPSQIQALNPILVLALIPVFSYGIYPALDKVFGMTPIRKIGGGLFVMVTAFALIAWVQERIDAGETPSIAWQLVGYVLLTASEVMVSITALEFSYTQAPRKMKSVIMAFFLWSVSLGNVFTGQVNSYVQVPSSTATSAAVATQANAWLLDNLDADDAKLPTASDLELPDDASFAPVEGGFSVTTAGFDDKFETADDVVVTYLATDDGSAVRRESVETAGLAETQLGVDRIIAAWKENGALPQTEAGQALIDGLLDPWGEQLVYTQQNRLQFRVLSTGPDTTLETRYDVGHVVELDLPEGEKKKSDRVSWLEARKKELGVDDERKRADGEEDPGYEANAFVGGQTKLEGAAYFWFFTWVMLGAALLFIPVGLLYKPRTYLQEELPAEEAVH